MPNLIREIQIKGLAAQLEISENITLSNLIYLVYWKIFLLCYWKIFLSI